MTQSTDPGAQAHGDHRSRTETGSNPTTTSREDAEQACREALARAPGDARLWLQYGVFAYNRGVFEEALERWQKAIELDDQLATAYFNRGVCLRKIRREQEAIDAFRAALRADPVQDAACAALVEMLAETGSYAEAMEASTKLLTLNPDAPATVAAHALALERRGKVQEAFAFLQPKVEGAIRDARTVIALGKVCQRMRPPSELAVPYLESLLEDATLSRSDRNAALKSLAHLHDASKRYHAAFDCMKKARTLEPVDLTVVQQRIDYLSSVRQHYTRDRLNRVPHSSNWTDLPIFVVGMPRSGTTLTEQILAAHPQVHGAGELTYLGKAALAGFGTEKPLPHSLDAVTSDNIETLSASIIASLRTKAPQARRVVDKMPLNFLHLGAMELLTPGARVVHCTRHPLDTCISIFFNDFTDALAYTRRLDTLARYYRVYVDLMRHWQETVRIRCLN